MTDPPANPLVLALANGRADAYGGLYDRLGPSLLRVARSILGASGDAEDAVQDLFVELVRNRDRITFVRDLDAYVFTMLRHAIGRRIKSRQNEQRHLRHLMPATIAEPSVLADDDLILALRSLPNEQREVIALKIDGGLTFAQIAEVMEVSPNTAASRYRYALEKLRIAMEPNS